MTYSASIAWYLDRFCDRHLTEAEIRNNNRSTDGAIIDKYLEIDRRYSGTFGLGENPFDPQNNGGVTFTHFSPTQCSRSNLNNHSIVTVVGYAGLKSLIPGDNENASWEELLQNPQFVQAIRGTDILLAPHHGRDAGFCESLFDYISPRLTIVSDGSVCDTSARDRYRNKSRGWKVYDGNSDAAETRYCLTTCSDGAVRVSMGHNPEGSSFLNVRVYR